MIKNALLNRISILKNSKAIQNNIGKRFFTNIPENKNETDQYEPFKSYKINYPSLNLLNNKPHVLIGMSGGIDSTIAAHLLKNQGFKVTGTYIKSWDEKDESGYCNGEKEFKYAQEASQWLGIELHHADFVKDYWNRVFVNFLDEYRIGKTPNPDVFCNREIKFDAFIDFGKELGINYVATGHYANLQYNNDTASLYRGKDYNKDQSYFLCMIKPEKLKNVIFPMGSFLKENVVKYGYSLGLDDIASKKSSRGICFIGKRNLPDFLSEYINISPGKYVDITGKYDIHQQHSGAITYTIGQKAMIHSLDQKYFVAGINPEANIVYVCPEDKISPYLHCERMQIKNFNWLENIPDQLKQGGIFNARCQVRHRGEVVPCTIESLPIGNPEDGYEYTISFSKPFKSTAEGQILCVFDSVTDKCYGGGVVHNVEFFKKLK